MSRKTNLGNWHPAILAIIGMVCLTAGPAAAQQRKIVSGDFNGDGNPDIAIGVPSEDVPGLNVVGFFTDAGSVHIIFGDENGLTTEGNFLIHEGAPLPDGSFVPGALQEHAYFGMSLAVFDADSDGTTDLVIGAPGARVGGRPNAGKIIVLRGLEDPDLTDGVIGGGLSAVDGQQIWQGKIEGNTRAPGIWEANDYFGWDIATGNFDGRFFDDIAVSAPGEDLGLKSKTDSGPVGPHTNTVRDAGAVCVFYSDQSGGVLLRIPDPAKSVFYTQSSLATGALNRPNSFLGFFLRSDDGNGDGRADLLAGSPGEDGNRGAVYLLRGLRKPGLLATADLRLDGQGFGAGPAPGDLFGFSGCFLRLSDGRGAPMGLAVGAPNTDVGNAERAGQVYLMELSNGSPFVFDPDAPMNPDGAEILNQDSNLNQVAPNPIGPHGPNGGIQAEALDGFGWNVERGILWSDVVDRDDLVAGVPYEGRGPGTLPNLPENIDENCGAVCVFRKPGTLLSDGGAVDVQQWFQGRRAYGILGNAHNRNVTRDEDGNITGRFPGNNLGTDEDPEFDPDAYFDRLGFSILVADLDSDGTDDDDGTDDVAAAAPGEDRLNIGDSLSTNFENRPDDGSDGGAISIIFNDGGRLNTVDAQGSDANGDPIEPPDSDGVNSQKWHQDTVENGIDVEDVIEGYDSLGGADEEVLYGPNGWFFGLDLLDLAD